MRFQHWRAYGHMGMALLIFMGVSACKHHQAASDAEAGKNSLIAADDADRPITGTRWVVREVNGQAIGQRYPGLAPDRIPYLEFSTEPNRVTGYTGCNRLSAEYSSEPEDFRFGMLITTRMACTDPHPAANIEPEFLEALNATTDLHITGDQLALMDSSGRIRLGFVASADSGNTPPPAGRAKPEK